MAKRLNYVIKYGYCANYNFIVFFVFQLSLLFICIIWIMFDKKKKKRIR